MEGLCFKRLEESYRGGVRSWRKYKVRVTTEAVIGAVTRSLAAHRTLLLGRYDPAGHLQYVSRRSVHPSPIPGSLATSGRVLRATRRSVRGRPRTGQDENRPHGPR
ncbi:hypothetical protein GCM10010320_61800 [Streptomyces caelestis]|nr:hypothetical protein GCM10010320_61800 [Streptomyces caelestis]